jgi:DHA1 family tetracycline resistance protein-like MFS transporter
LGAALLVGIGQGLASPTIVGLLSRVSPASEQGAIFGALTSAQTLARMINYMLANSLLGRGGPSAPYWEGAGVAAIALGVACWTVFTFVGFTLPAKEKTAIADPLLE